jgi:hypothetical protein
MQQDAAPTNSGAKDEVTAAIESAAHNKWIFTLQEFGAQVSGCTRPGTKVVLRRVLQKTGEYKWELVKRKDWQLN